MHQVGDPADRASPRMHQVSDPASTDCTRPAIQRIKRLPVCTRSAIQQSSGSNVSPYASGQQSSLHGLYQASNPADLASMAGNFEWCQAHKISRTCERSNPKLRFWGSNPANGQPTLYNIDLFWAVVFAMWTGGTCLKYLGGWHITCLWHWVRATLSHKAG